MLKQKSTICEDWSPECTECNGDYGTDQKQD